MWRDEGYLLDILLALRADFSELSEFVKNLGLVLGGDAHSRISNPHFNLSRIGVMPYPDEYGAASRSEFQSIADQVDQHLLDAFSVNLHSRQTRWQLHSQANVLPARVMLK